MNTDTPEKQPVADGVSQSALIRRCTALLTLAACAAAGNFIWQAVDAQNWAVATERTLFQFGALITTLTLPYE